MYRSVIPPQFSYNSLFPIPPYSSFDILGFSSKKNKKNLPIPFLEIQRKFKEFASPLINDNIAIFTDGSKKDEDWAVGAAVFFSKLHLTIRHNQALLWHFNFFSEGLGHLPSAYSDWELSFHMCGCLFQECSGRLFISRLSIDQVSITYSPWSGTNITLWPMKDIRFSGSRSHLIRISLVTKKLISWLDKLLPMAENLTQHRANWLALWSRTKKFPKALFWVISSLIYTWEI